MSKRIEVRDLTVTYRGRGSDFTAIDDVSLTVEPGEFVSLIGSSGCGKSTLLSVLEGLQKPTAGGAYEDGKLITGPGPDRAVVFQQYSLFPWLTAQGNVEFALEQSHRELGRKQRREKAAYYLERVGLSGFGKRYPKELSGGQQQRVAIARALAVDADVLLMDEPFGAIDARNRAVLQDLLLELWEGEPGDERKTVVFVTHDLDEAILLSDRIVMMEPGHVKAEFKVPLGRPRKRVELLSDRAYIEFRSKVSAVFFEDEAKEVRCA